MHGFDYKELFIKFRYAILITLGGLVLIGAGIFLIKSARVLVPAKVEILGVSSQNINGASLTVEIAGEVNKPGVYTIPADSRINDLLISAGGTTDMADIVWVGKYLNKAALLTDGQKIYIPPIANHSDPSTAKSGDTDQTISSQNITDSSGIIDINTASLDLLMSLSGIGQKYGQSIIEHRPYSNTEELVKKEVIGKTLFEKIKDKISVY